MLRSETAVNPQTAATSSVKVSKTPCDVRMLVQMPAQFQGFRLPLIGHTGLSHTDGRIANLQPVC